MIEKAKEYNYVPQVVVNSRLVNESVPKFITQKIKEIIKDRNKNVKNQKILVLGYTFRENIDDIRNTKVEDLILNLQSEDMDVSVADPYVETEILQKSTKANVVDYNSYCEYDILVLAVSHDEFKNISLEKFHEKNKDGIIIDIKNYFNKDEIENLGIDYWRF